MLVSQPHILRPPTDGKLWMTLQMEVSQEYHEVRILEIDLHVLRIWMDHCRRVQCTVVRYRSTLDAYLSE
jgi:hypothetical protein